MATRFYSNSISVSKVPQDGVSISKVTEKYALSAELVVPTEWKDEPLTMTEVAGKYLWNYEIITYSNGKTEETSKRVIGVYGEKGATGQEGTGIQAITYTYKVTKYQDQPSPDTITEAAPPTMDGETNKYLWQKEVITYTRGDPTVNVYLIGVYGDKGETGETGAQGLQGENGWSQATISLFRRSASKPTDIPLQLYYTFKTGALTSGVDGKTLTECLNGWSRTVTTGSDPLYVIYASAFNSTETDPIDPNDWSPAEILSENGTKGDKGYSVLNIVLYQRSESQPQEPQNVVTYNFYDGTVSGEDIGEGKWTKSFPEDNGFPLWVTNATAATQETSDVITSSEWSTPQIMAQNGEDGTSVTITKKTVEYASSTSGTVTPSSWNPDPTPTSGQYLWTKTYVKYSDDNETTAYSVSYIGKDGDSGISPKLTGQKVEYLNSTDGTSIPSGTWSDTATPEKGKYTWSRTTLTYSDDTTAYTYSVSYTANDGATGKAGKNPVSVILSSESYTLTAPTKGIIDGTQISSVVSVVQSVGGVLKSFSVVSASPTTNGTYYVTASATGISYITVSGATVKGTSSSAMTADTATIAVNVYYKDFDGESGTVQKTISIAQSVKGDTGTSVTITGKSVQYASSTSGTTTPSDSAWKDTVPSVSAGSYLWTRTIVTYSDGNSTTAYSVAYMGKNGASPKLTSQSVAYQNSSSGTTIPTDTTAWKSTATPTQGQYTWTRTTLTYSDSTTAYTYSVSYTAKDGEDGEKGQSLTSATEQYATSTSTTTAPDSSSFSDTKPEVTSGNYLWRRLKLVWANPTATTYTTATLVDTVDTQTPYIRGTQTASTNAWTGNAPTIAALYSGLTIRYYLPYGASSNVTLNLTLKDGTTTGAIYCYYGATTRLTSHYGAGSVLTLTYLPKADNKTGYNGWFCTPQYYSYDNYNNRYNNSILAKTAVTQYALIGAADETGYFNIVAGSVISTKYPLLMAGSAIAASKTNSNAYIGYYSLNLAKNVSGLSFTTYKPVYVKGVYSADGTFTVDSTTPFTQTEPTTADGNSYIRLGIARSGTAVCFEVENKIWNYVNGVFCTDSAQVYDKIESTRSDLQTEIDTANGEIALRVKVSGSATDGTGQLVVGSSYIKLNAPQILVDGSVTANEVSATGLLKGKSFVVGTGGSIESESHTVDSSKGFKIWDSGHIDAYDIILGGDAIIRGSINNRSLKALSSGAIGQTITNLSWEGKYWKGSELFAVFDSTSAEKMDGPCYFNGDEVRYIEYRRGERLVIRTTDTMEIIRSYNSDGYYSDSIKTVQLWVNVQCGPLYSEWIGVTTKYERYTTGQETTVEGVTSASGNSFLGQDANNKNVTITSSSITVDGIGELNSDSYYIESEWPTYTLNLLDNNLGTYVSDLFPMSESSNVGSAEQKFNEIHANSAEITSIKGDLFPMSESSNVGSVSQPFNEIHATNINVTGNITGNVKGNVTGDTTGTHIGNVNGDSSGVNANAASYVVWGAVAN